MPNTKSMDEDGFAAGLPWYQGLFGGLIGGVLLVVGTLALGALLHDAPDTALRFAASALIRTAATGPLGVPLGVALYLLLGGILGIVFASIGGSRRALISGPSGFVTGALYGLVVSLVIENLAIPALALDPVQPLWLHALFTAVFFGIPLVAWTSSRSAHVDVHADFSSSYS